MLASYGQGFWLLGSVATFTGYVAFELFSSVALVFLAAITPESPIRVYIIFVGAAAAGFAAFIAMEEFWKLNFTRWHMIKREHRVGHSNAKAFVIAAASASLGHASAFSMILSIIVVSLMGKTIDSGEFGLMVLFAFIFALASMPLNVLTAYVHALELQFVSRDALLMREPVAEGPGAPAGDSDPHAAPQGSHQSSRPVLCLPNELLAILKWPVSVRTVYSVHWTIWPLFLSVHGLVGYIIATILVVLGVLAAHVVVIRRIRMLEAELPSLPTTGLQQRFGYALLAAETPSAANEIPLPPRYGDTAGQTTGGPASAPETPIQLVAVVAPPVGAPAASPPPPTQTAVL